ncbi:MAG TPA: hypothetical protein VFZ61_21355 [Polyangiales bacterium]
MSLTKAQEYEEPSRRALLGFCLASFVALSFVPLYGKSGYADLSSQFSDHLHHVYGVWLFWKHGVAALTTPFGQLTSEGFPHQVALWPQTPWMYPAGTLLLFAPLTALAKLMPLTLHQLAITSVLYLSLWSHLGFYLFARALGRLSPGPRLFLTAIAWLMLMRLTVEGFFDPLWLGAGAAVVGCAGRGQHERALLWFAVAASLHYRAVVFVPAGLYAFLAIVLRRAPRDWPHMVLSITALVCLSTVGFFLKMRPAHAAYVDQYPHVGRSLFLYMFLLLTAATAAHQLRLRCWVGAATVLLAGVVGAADFRGFFGYWHHAPTMLALPVAAGLGLAEPAAQKARASALLYGLALSRMIWGCSPFDLLFLLADKLSWVVPPPPVP